MFGLFGKKDRKEFKIPGGEAVFFYGYNKDLGHEPIYIDITASQHRLYSTEQVSKLKEKIMEEFRKFVSYEMNHKLHGGFYDGSQVHIIVRDIGLFDPKNETLLSLFKDVSESLIKNGASYNEEQ